MKHISEFHARTLQNRGPAWELREALCWVEMAALAEWCPSAVPEVFLCADAVKLSNLLNLGAFCLTCSDYKEHYYIRMVIMHPLDELW